MSRLPKVFISYSWEEDGHKEWVRDFALRLVSDGIEVTLDQWHTVPGDMLTEFMERAIRDNDFVLIVCTPAYKTKSETRRGGVGYEGDIITSEVLAYHNHRKFIPILRRGEWETAAPSWLLGKYYIDLRSESYPSKNYELLVEVLKGNVPKLDFTSKNLSSVQPIRSKVWNIPHLRNPNFTGRGLLIDAIRNSLRDSEKSTLVIQAIHGIGGIGKTQLAIEYAYRFSDEYDLVWWVRAEEPSLLMSDFSDLAAKLNLSSPEIVDPNITLELVHKWLNANPRWLLIFDNAVKPNDIVQFIPKIARGHTIITSRNPNWGGIGKPVFVNTFNRDEAIHYLLQITGQDDVMAAGQLANAMGDLPLALAQAAAYIQRTGISLDSYLRVFRSKREELWRKESPPTDYHHTVATTWSLSIETIEKEFPQAIDLIELCSFLGPDSIPLELFSNESDFLPEELQTATSNDLEFNDLIASLRAFSLLERRESTISFHRLVQAITRDRLQIDEKKMWATIALKILKAAFPQESEKTQNWEACELLLPHALASSRHAKVLQVELKTNSVLLTAIGFYFRSRGDYDSAEKVFKDELDLGDTEYEQIR